MHTSKPWYKPKWLKNSIFNEKSHKNKRDFNPSNVLMMSDDPTEVIKSINDEFCLYETRQKKKFSTAAFVH